ncbi:hypothetical protein, partial [Bifidobacterium sp.]|uniref:hypothetical protein n=1 Tax=Bifidobacterium sp. TaxID=41200 RepID=UPI003D7EC697
MSKNLVDSIAGDLGICSVQTEQKNEYTRRIQYTALRYWMMAYTLDDGFGGAYGVSEKTVIRKAERWLNEMEEMHLPEGKTKPLSQKDYRDICRTMLWNMIAIGDLAKTSDNMVRCVEGHTVMFAPGMNAIVGFNDPTIRRHN